MTFNIRVNVQSDSLNSWPHRKESAASMIRFHRADIAGLQEALFDQIEDLAVRLPDYQWFGVGRDDGLRSGECMAVFYLKERFEVLGSGTFWLSEHPEIPGRGWDAACNRTVTWGRFKDHRTGTRFCLFNTHFDHLGGTAREESARLLLDKVMTIAVNLPVAVTGDFNSTPDSEVYRILTKGIEGKPGSALVDAEAVSLQLHHGPRGTFTGFQLSNLAGNDRPIDYLFIKNGVQVLSHGTLSDTFNGRFPSDHMPVLAEMMVE
jgi:endonuclease/exonuclease/phosphatase family metal-dependent hydrolase